MNPAVIGILITVIFVGALLTGSFVYWGVASRRESKSRSMARRLGTNTGSQSGIDLFQARQNDPLVDALGFVGRHLEDVARQSGLSLTASTLAARIGRSEARGPCPGLAGRVRYSRWA